MGKCLFMRKGETHSKPYSGILASDLSVGSSVYLNENGSPVEYLVVNQGIPSDSSSYDSTCNGTWLLRKDIHSTNKWSTSSSNSNYQSSMIHSYLTSNDFLGTFDATTLERIKTINLPCSDRAGGGYNLSAQFFLLSAFELGFDRNMNSDIPFTGAKLSYFENSNTSSTANEKRKASLPGELSTSSWWMRDPYVGTSTGVWSVASGGTYSSLAATTMNGVRPALILPSNAVFDKDTLVLKGVA